MKPRLASIAAAATALAGLGPAAFAQAPAATLDLVQAYRLALDHDAGLRAARSALQARSERLPQARSQLLPQIGATLGWYRNELDSTAPGVGGVPAAGEARYASSARALTVRQPVYRPVQLADHRQAQAQLAHAQAAFEAESQHLAVRVTEAYLQALGSEDMLVVVAAQKTAIEVQLDAARRRQQAGSGTRTEVDEALARLDLVRARELEAMQNLSYTGQRLESMVGVPVGRLAPIDARRFVPMPPDPVRVEDWIALAEQGSPELRALQSQLEAARLEIDKAEAAHRPTLDAVAQVGRSNADNITRIDTRYLHRSIGLQLTVPLFSGGYTASRVRQAAAEAQQAEHLLEAARADLALRVYREYRGVTEGTLRVRALEQALRSAQTLVQSTLRSYEAGSRTQVDVLNAQQQWSEALLQLAEARHAYLLSRIRLSALGGQANLAAIVDASSWLSTGR